MTVCDNSLIFIAASGLAREALAVVRAHNLYQPIGFLDDSEALAGAMIDELPVLGPTAAIVDFPNARILICAGRGVVREKIVNRLAALGVSADRYATVVDPSVDIPKNCLVEAGSIILGGVRLTTSVTVGEHVVVMPNAILTHDCVVSAYATVCAGVALGGNVVVERGAYIGMNASVRERAKVGAASTLGMGSALLQDIPAGETWVGVPARPMTSVKRAVADVSKPASP